MNAGGKWPEPWTQWYGLHTQYPPLFILLEHQSSRMRMHTSESCWDHYRRYWMEEGFKGGIQLFKYRQILAGGKALMMLTSTQATSIWELWVEWKMKNCQNRMKKNWAIFNVYIYQNIVLTHQPKTKYNPWDFASHEIKPVFLKSTEPHRHGRPGERHKFQTARRPSFFQSHQWALELRVTIGGNIKCPHLKPEGRAAITPGFPENKVASCQFHLWRVLAKSEFFPTSGPKSVLGTAGQAGYSFPRRAPETRGTEHNPTVCFHQTRALLGKWGVVHLSLEK